jgi:hypothetical protein
MMTKTCKNQMKKCCRMLNSRACNAVDYLAHLSGNRIQ